jgi:SAM-dependent methyltransferase
MTDKRVSVELIRSMNRLALWARRKRVIKPRAEVVKLNLGSGLSVAGGWINVDASPVVFFSKWPSSILKMLYKTWGSLLGFTPRFSQSEYCNILKNNIFVHHNIEYGIPFPDESVDYLYSSHLLEHLFREDAKKLLREAWRVLKKGGTIRIGVPDLEYAVLLYQRGKKEEALRYFFPTSKSGYFSRHKYMYDFDTLRGHLEEAEFVNIVRRSCRQGKTPDIDVLDSRPEETLYVEASKK